LLLFISVKKSPQAIPALALDPRPQPPFKVSGLQRLDRRELFGG